eukprot:6576720-Prymnesium_polylepis.2
MYSPKQIPIKATIAEHFGVFNKVSATAAPPHTGSCCHTRTRSARRAARAAAAPPHTWFVLP